MKAIGYTQSLPISDPQSLLDIELPQPTASGHDLLVKVSAIAVNPVDYKIRQNVHQLKVNTRLLVGMQLARSLL
jgi:NADPH:quinone reductase-like Zn-dependent oxidoreductase